MRKEINKKTFWYTCLIANFTWLYAFISLALERNTGLGSIIISQILIFLIAYGTVLNVQFLNAKKRNNAKSFSKMATIFLTISIAIFGLVLFDNIQTYLLKKDLSDFNKPTTHQERLNKLLENANSFEDCLEIDALSGSTIELRNCFYKIYNKTNDVGACQSATKSLTGDKAMDFYLLCASLRQLE